MANIAFAVGLVAGLAIVLVVLSVAHRAGSFTAHGTWTLALGVALIGMSVWGRVSIGPSGIELVRLQQQVHEIAEGASLVAGQVEDLAVNVEGTREQLVSVTRALRTQGGFDPTILGPIEDSLAMLPAFDITRPREATETFERAERELRTREDFQP